MPPTTRLPNWTFEETLLAYDLYLQEYAEPLRYPDGANPAVLQLSRDLRSLSIHPLEARSDPRFRNPAGVARKIQNLMYVATEGATGSENGSAVDLQVVAESADRRAIHELALAVRSGLTVGEARSTVGGVGTKPTLAQYEDAVTSLEGELEKEVLTKRRLEQSFLRQHLLQDNPDGGCAFCGRTMPANLLVAAHIQRRADLGHDEKLRFNEIAVLACSLGCDALFEQGYIAVSANGEILVTEVEVATALREQLDALSGRVCAEHDTKRAPHFARHLASRLLRP